MLTDDEIAYVIGRYVQGADFNEVAKLLGESGPVTGKIRTALREVMGVGPMPQDLT